MPSRSASRTSKGPRKKKTLSTSRAIESRYHLAWQPVDRPTGRLGTSNASLPSYRVTWSSAIFSAITGIPGLTYARRSRFSQATPRRPSARIRVRGLHPATSLLCRVSEPTPPAQRRFVFNCGSIIPFPARLSMQCDCFKRNLPWSGRVGPSTVPSPPLRGREKRDLESIGARGAPMLSKPQQSRDGTDHRWQDVPKTALGRGSSADLPQGNPRVMRLPWLSIALTKKGRDIELKRTGLWRNWHTRRT